MELNELKQLLSMKCHKLAYELISLTLRFEKGGSLLSLVVDRPKSISMSDIVSLTHELNVYLDEINPFPGSYMLDISSLGAEKPLKIDDLANYINEYINVKLSNPISGLCVYEGQLVGLDDESITISYKVKTRNKEVNIAKANITHIRLAIKF